MHEYGRVLALGAHTDDIELGCGGYLNRLVRESSEILCVAFSRAEESLPEGMPNETLQREFEQSISTLGAQASSRTLKYKVRHFPSHRQEILEDLVKIRREFNPTLVLTMNSSDTHQDHEVIHKESVRAFRGVTLLGYELPWNQQQNVINLFVQLAPSDLDGKIAMLSCYESQKKLGRPYVDPEYTKSAAVFRGYQARLNLAEAYEVITMQSLDRK